MYSTIRIGSQNIAHILEIMLSCIVNNNVSELRSVFVPACRSVLCLNCQMNANLLHFRSIDTFYVHHNTSESLTRFNTVQSAQHSTLPVKLQN